MKPLQTKKTKKRPNKKNIKLRLNVIAAWLNGKVLTLLVSKFTKKN